MSEQPPGTREEAEEPQAGEGVVAGDRAWETDRDWERDARRERLEAQRAAEAEAAVGDAADRHDIPTLARVIEGLLFLSPEPVPASALAAAAGASDEDVDAAIALLDRQFAPGARGLIIKRVAGGLSFATDPICEPAARALLSKPADPAADGCPGRDPRDRRLPPAGRPPGDLQDPRRRGGFGDGDAAGARAHRGVRALGLRRGALPHHRSVPAALRSRRPVSAPRHRTWDPAPEEEDELRERLLRAGGARSGAADAGPAVELPEPRELDLTTEGSQPAGGEPPSAPAGDA